jgi:molecular chaperone GrpE
LDEQNTTQTQDEQAVADASSDVREEATVDEQEATPVDNDTSAEVADTDAAADGDTEVTLEEALSALAAVRAESEKHKDAWQRERAEFANYKKRVERERAEAYENAAADVMKSLLPDHRRL